MNLKWGNNLSYRELFPNIKDIDSIVMFSTADWDNPFWTNKQHVASQLAKQGFKVLYIESLGLRKLTVSKGDFSRILRRINRFFMGTRQVDQNIWVYSPIVLPFQGSSIAEILNRLYLKWMIQYFMWKLSFKKTLGWTYNPLVRGILKSLNLNKIVYHSVDDLSAAPRLPKEKIEQEERLLVNAADIVFVTSKILVEKYKLVTDKKIFYYPNVADYQHFNQALLPQLTIPKDIAEIGTPRIGFIGAISGYKLDFQMIARAADITPLWNWILIGKIGEGDPLTDASVLNKNNIHLMGPRSYEELPAYLKSFDVVIIPSPINDYTRSMFPMKFFEYLSAGKIIVSTDLPSLREFKHAFLRATTSEEMVSQIKRVLQGEVVFTEEMASLAKEHTWTNRMNHMLQDLNSMMES